jgi:hypothetical protein
MPWFRVEDSFHGHPKVTDAGNAAVGLWVRCGTYSAQWLTDGYIPARVARGFGSRREIEALLGSRLWVPADGGYLMPDYLDYNPSAEQVKLERKRAAERQRRQRERGWEALGHDDTGRFMSRRD